MRSRKAKQTGHIADIPDASGKRRKWREEPSGSSSSRRRKKLAERESSGEINCALIVSGRDIAATPLENNNIWAEREREGSIFLLGRLVVPSGPNVCIIFLLPYIYREREREEIEISRLFFRYIFTSGPVITDARNCYFGESVSFPDESVCWILNEIQERLKRARF